MSDWVSQFKTQFSNAIMPNAAAIQGVSPACALAPADEAELAAIIRVASIQKVPVVPLGGSTRQGSGKAPPANFLALSTAKLNKLIHHEPGDMVATVQAGMTLDAFQDAIRVRGQWLPIDAAPGATIGGIVAANTCGPRSLGYGTLRDSILGMTVVNGDGVARKCGGKVVKNVTGYALDKLYIGSFGTLGVVTEVTFKLRPLSVGGRYWSETVTDLSAGIEVLHAISALNLPLEMLQVLKAEKSALCLLVCAAGTDAELDRIESELKKAAPKLRFKGLSFDPAADVKVEHWAYTQSAAWSAHESALLENAHDRTSAGALLRFGCVASKLNAALRLVLSGRDAALFSFGMNSGAVELAPLTDTEAGRIAAALEKLGVNFAFENVVGVKIENRFGSPRPEWTLMQQIKRTLDPNGVMNPGRYVV